jgi:hypothetical protein
LVCLVATDLMVSAILPARANIIGSRSPGVQKSGLDPRRSRRLSPRSRETTARA